MVAAAAAVSRWTAGFARAQRGAAPPMRSRRGIRELHRELGELRASLAAERTMRLDLEERRESTGADSEAAGAAQGDGRTRRRGGRRGPSTGGSAAPDEAPIPLRCLPTPRPRRVLSPFENAASRATAARRRLCCVGRRRERRGGRRPRERHGAKDAKAKGVGEALVEEGGVGNDVSDDVSASAPATAAVVAPGAIAFAPEMGEEQEASPIPPELRAAYGTFSCHGVEPIERPDGTCVEEAKINQDCAGVAYPVGGRADAALFCVYDGHGEHGHVVSHGMNGATQHWRTGH